MNFSGLDAKKLIVIATLILVPLLTVNMERNITETHWALKPFSFALGSLQSLYSGFSAGVQGTTAMYLDLIGIKKENRQLLNENAELRAQLGALTELKMENERLNDLLGFKKNSKMSLLAARVIGKDLLPDHNTLTINRGEKHGLKKNMAALTVGGVVGYVFRTEPYSSQILLLTDRYAAIDAIVQRSRARGIIEGAGQDVCDLQYLKRGDDIVVGDQVVTSGLDNIFPKGFPIGSVTRINKTQYGMSQEVEVAPAINPQTLEEIFVVLNARHETFMDEDLEDEALVVDEGSITDATKKASSPSNPKPAPSPSAPDGASPQLSGDTAE